MRAELMVEVGTGRHSGSRATLDDLCGEWIIELRRKGRSPNTISGYEQLYRRNSQPTLGGKQVTKLTVKTLTDLYGAHQDRGLAPRTVYQTHACLSSMLTQACRWGWRWDRDVDLEQRVMKVSASVTKLRGRPIEEIPTKIRRERTLAIDDFTDAADGSVPWKPDAVSKYFMRLRPRIGLDHLDVHDVRKFMATCGQEMACSVTQVAMRAGHDRSIAAPSTTSVA